jgi:hypothetical protein
LFQIECMWDSCLMDMCRVHDIPTHILCIGFSVP